MQSIKREYCIIMWKGHLIFGEISQIYPVESKFLIAGIQCFLHRTSSQQHFSYVPLETEYNAVRVINYTILRRRSPFIV